MSKFLCKIIGSRGRTLNLYDNKCVIETKVTAGSILTRNTTDGEKTLFFCDICGVQYKKSKFLIGYLQFETPSMQMNNENDNFFSENTFTFEDGKNGVTNELIKTVYQYIVNRIEEIKYGVKVIDDLPDFDILYKDVSSNGDNDIDIDENKEELENEYQKDPLGNCKLLSNNLDDFISEIKKYTAEELFLILNDQRDLYTEQEIEIIENEYNSKIDK